jgi:hypothetical protein
VVWITDFHRLGKDQGCRIIREHAEKLDSGESENKKRKNERKGLQVKEEDAVCKPFGIKVSRLSK